MKLFHVSLNLDIQKEFIPRIPSENIMVETEDRTTPRICFSKTIRGCLTAVPWGGNSIEDIFFDNYVSQLIRVYEFDSKDVAKENLIKSKKLYQTDKVRDAEISGEVWVINQNIKPKKTYLIQITDYSEGCADDISYEDLKNFNEEDDDLEDIINGSFTTVEYVQYDTIKEVDNCDKLSLVFKVNINEKDDITQEDDETSVFLLKKFGINTKDKLPNREYIYNKIDNFLSEHWEDRDVIIKDSDKLGIYIIDLYVDLTNKPTTEDNFLINFKNDIGIIQAISFIN